MVSNIYVNGVVLADRYVVWVDPDIGFCPRRIEAHWPDDTAIITASLSSYVDIGGNVWFPKSVKWVIAHPGQADSVGVATVLSARVVPEATALTLDTSFPSGTAVEDKVLGAEYIVP